MWLPVSTTNLNSLGPHEWIATKFSGSTQLLASNFRAGDLDPGPSGSGPDPEKGLSLAFFAIKMRVYLILIKIMSESRLV